MVAATVSGSPATSDALVTSIDHTNSVPCCSSVLLVGDPSIGDTPGPRPLRSRTSVAGSPAETARRCMATAGRYPRSGQACSLSSIIPLERGKRYGLSIIPVSKYSIVPATSQHSARISQRFPLLLLVTVCLSRASANSRPLEQRGIARTETGRRYAQRTNEGPLRTAAPRSQQAAITGHRFFRMEWRHTPWINSRWTTVHRHRLNCPLAIGDTGPAG